MTIRANVDNKFIRRFLYISIGCFLFMLYGLYDGLFVYPIELERSQHYYELKKKVESGELTEATMAESWNQTAKEKKWALAKPKSPEVAQNYVYFQWFVFGIGLILGVFFLIKYMKLLNSWMESDGKEISTSWGESLQLNEITKIDKRKWEKKGIAEVEYKDDSGATKTMVFDDFKFDRSLMAEIMQQAEKNLKPEQIVGGISAGENESVQS